MGPRIPTGLSLGLCVLLAMAVGPYDAAGSEQATEFRRDVAPLLQAKCLTCHNDHDRKGDLSLQTPEDLQAKGLVKPGDPEKSRLLRMVMPGERGEAPAMPQTGTPLTEREISRLRSWILEGAKWPDGYVIDRPDPADWWAYQPLRRGPIPVDFSLDEHIAGPIDVFVAARLRAAGLRPNGPTDRRTWLRRVSYTLTGLPPDPDLVERFVLDGRPDARDRVVDRLLASPAFGEQWGRHWLDVVRFGESNGFERNVLINNVWPYRDYVIASFNADKPFNRFIVEQLAGDQLAPDDPAVAVGTAFLVCGPYDNVGNQDPVQAAIIRANTIDEMIRATGEAFLGITMGCARCHDHKFDPITQDDYYGWYATFAGVRHGAREIASPEMRRARQEKLAPLLARKRELETSRKRLVDTILARAEAKREQYERAWVREPVSRYLTVEEFAPVQARFVRLTVYGRDDQPYSRTDFSIDEFEVWTAGENPRNVALSVNGAEAEGASRVARDFPDAYSAKRAIDGKFGSRWIAGGPVLTITLPGVFTVSRVVFSSDRPRELPPTHYYTRFVSDYEIEVSLDGNSWRKVAASWDRKPVSDAHRRKRLLDATISESERAELQRLDDELARVQRAIDAVPPLPVWWVGTMSEAPGPFYVFGGGDPQRKLREVTPRSIRVLERTVGVYELDPGASEGERRLALARWIASDTNSLTLRVLANRLWHYSFGRGIVRTPGEFGRMGAKPTHPELLDYLAARLLEHGWRVKPVVREIVLSATFARSSSYRQDAAAVDGDAELLWRFPPRRLSGEEIRDTMLAVAGVLDRRMGGPGFRLYRYLEDNVATYEPLDEVGPETYRRAVYHQRARAAWVDVLSDFDCPDPVFPTSRRTETVGPLQALTMLNHDFVLDMAGYLAERVKRAEADPEEQVRLVFRLVLLRAPDAVELEAGTKLAERFGLRALCRALLNSNEFIYLD